MPNAHFNLAIDEWTKNTKEQIEALARQSIQEMAFRVVEATPVDTGFLRGSWQPSINVMADGPLGKTGHVVKAHPDPEGAAAMTKISATVLDMKLGDTFYMSNNAAYALRMEYGFVGEDSLGRKYHQEGRFYVTGTVEQWPEIVKQMAASLGMTPGAGPAPPRNLGQYGL